LTQSMTKQNYLLFTTEIIATVKQEEHNDETACNMKQTLISLSRETTVEAFLSPTRPCQ